MDNNGESPSPTLELLADNPTTTTTANESITNSLGTTIMVAPGSFGKYEPGPPSTAFYVIMLIVFAVFSLGCGSMAATQPPGAGWRFFSWHPFLMTCGMVGLFGAAIMTKKRGGYFHTKVHGMLTMAGLVLSLGTLRRARS